MSVQKLKLSAETLTILKNFASINKSLIFKKGSKLSTISESKAVLGSAEVAETFESQFAIYDVSRLMSVMSLFPEPELEIHDNQLTIKGEGGRRVNYTFADVKTLINPPEKVNFPAADIEFDLPNATFAEVNKALLVMKLPEYAVVGEDGKMYLRALDSKNPTGDIYSTPLGDTEWTGSMIFKAENIRFLPLDYNVKISTKGMAFFETADKKVSYYAATEAQKK